MRKRLLVAGGAALILLGACGDDGDTDTAERDSGASAGDDESTQVIDFDAFAELPEPPDGASLGDRLPTAEWDGDLVLVGPAGGLIRVDGDGGTEFVPTDGIDGGEEGTVIRTVDALAADDEILLAVGQQDDLIADVFPSRRPVVWRSDDGETWETIDPDGLYDLDEVRVAGVIADEEGGEFIAFGRRDDGRRAETALWRSDDGEAWERIETPGLDEIGRGPGTSAELVDLAVIDDSFLGVVNVEGQDDEALTIVRAERDGPWAELPSSGLDPLDLPNTDIFPPLAAVDREFGLFASVPVDESNEFGERSAALFTAADGEAWEVTELDGPSLPDPQSSLALTSTEAGAIGLSAAEDGIVLWRIVP